MKPTEQTLVDQMRITDFEIEHRKELFSITEEDIKALKSVRISIESQLDSLVDQFYKMQSSIPEIALLIGDADTMARLRSAQRKYVIDLFSGLYDLEYVNNRLRIGLVHKRIGVEPTLYLSAIFTLKGMLTRVIRKEVSKEADRSVALNALEKLLFFDVTLVFETYIRSLVSEIQISKNKSEQYARSLEEKVQERTRQLEEISSKDPLTGLLNLRLLDETLTNSLRAAQRRSEPLTIVFIDLNDFKIINDTQGHQKGDEILRLVGTSLQKTTRSEDSCFRYGGDEFCVIMPNCRENQAKEVFIQRLNGEIQQHKKNISLSIGIVQTGPNEYMEPDRLMHEVDKKMYAAKQEIKSTPSAEIQNSLEKVLVPKKVPKSAAKDEALKHP